MRINLHLKLALLLLATAVAPLAAFVPRTAVGRRRPVVRLLSSNHHGEQAVAANLPKQARISRKNLVNTESINDDTASTPPSSSSLYQTQAAIVTDKAVVISTKKKDAPVASVRLLRSLTESLYPPAQAAVERRMAEFLERSVERVAERQGLRRLGSACLAILPLLGAAFALYLAQHDVHRARNEYQKHVVTSASSVTLLPPTTSSNRNDNGLNGNFLMNTATVVATALFCGAALADVVDAGLHLHMSHALWMNMDHGRTADEAGSLLSVPQLAMVGHDTGHAVSAMDATTTTTTFADKADTTEWTLAQLEEWSSSCVLASSLCVALREIVSFGWGPNTSKQTAKTETTTIVNQDSHSTVPPVEAMEQT